MQQVGRIAFSTRVFTIYENLLCYICREFETFESSMLNEGDEELLVFPKLEDLVPNVQTKPKRDTILE